MVTQRSRLVANYGLKPINPVQCGSEQCEPEHDYGPASRHHWLLHFVVSGGGSFRTARGKYELGAGDIFIIRPYEVTYYCASMRDPWEYIWIGFTSEKTLPAAITSRDYIHAPYLEPLFRSAVAADGFGESDGTTGAYEHFLSGIIWQITGLLMRLDVAPFTTAEAYVHSAISIIEAEYSTALTVSSLAERLHLNRSYFSGIFKQRTGVSPHKYLTDYRMRQARELMVLHGCSVSVAAISVGFPDVFAFSRAYKKYFGHSPSCAKRQ